METKARLIGKTKDLVSGKYQLTFAIDRVSEELNKFDEKDLSLKVGVWREKRSLSANSYFHVLVDKIAKAVSSSRFRVKNELIAKYGQPLLLATGEQVIYKSNAPVEYMLEQEFIHAYPCKMDGAVTFYKIYRGSHEYNTKEMAELIDGTVAEAKELGIETMTPEQLGRMIATWEANRCRE